MLDRVYAHSSVEMDEIDVIGFDFDHTLVCYKKELNRRVQRRPLLLMARQGFTDGLEYVSGLLARPRQPSGEGLLPCAARGEPRSRFTYDLGEAYL